jgi:hypothetical protein
LIYLFSFNVLHPDGIYRLQKHEQQITNIKTFDKRNPPPLTVSCAHSGDEGPTVYIQTKERKTKTPPKQKLPVPRAENNPGGLPIPPYT